MHRKLLADMGLLCAVDTLSKVLKEAEAAELVVEQDPIGAILLQRATAGKRWQDQARQVMSSLKVSLAKRCCCFL